MREIGWRLIVILLMVGVWDAAAQSDGTDGTNQADGQFCVRAFIDANANGQIDPGEEFIEANLVANLQTADGVVIDTQSMSDSPTRAQGLLCFALSPGDYRVFVTSAVYEPTTDAALTATINAAGLPAVLEYGGQVIGVEPSSAEPAPEDNPLERLLVSTMAAVIAMLVFGGLGLVWYLLALRPRLKQSESQPTADSDARFRRPGSIRPDQIYDDEA
jgi:hypothetical protein